MALPQPLARQRAALPVAVAQPLAGQQAALPVAVTQPLAGGTSKQSQRQPQPVCSRESPAAGGEAKKPTCTTTGETKGGEGAVGGGVQWMRASVTTESTTPMPTLASVDADRVTIASASACEASTRQRAIASAC